MALPKNLIASYRVMVPLELDLAFIATSIKNSIGDGIGL